MRIIRIKGLTAIAAGVIFLALILLLLPLIMGATIIAAAIAAIAGLRAKRAKRRTKQKKGKVIEAEYRVK